MQQAKVLLRNMRDVDTINLAGETALCLSMKRRSRNWLSQSLIDSGVRLLLSKLGIEMGLKLDVSFNGVSYLNCYMRQGSNTLTKRLGHYAKDPQDSVMIFSERPLVVLQSLLQDPESLDLNDLSWL